MFSAIMAQLWKYCPGSFRSKSGFSPQPRSVTSECTVANGKEDDQKYDGLALLLNSIDRRFWYPDFSIELDHGLHQELRANPVSEK